MNTQNIFIEISDELSKCFLVQSVFGKSAADVPSMVAVFLEDIPKKHHGQVAMAIKLHRKKSDKFPTPACLLAILNPCPVVDHAMMRIIARKRERGENLSFSEEGYLEIHKRLAMEAIEPPSLEKQWLAICGEEHVDLKALSAPSHGRPEIEIDRPLDPVEPEITPEQRKANLAKMEKLKASLRKMPGQTEGQAHV